MSSYLVIKNGTKTKSYACKSSAEKPYIKVSTYGYLPLTTETTTKTGLRVKVDNIVHYVEAEASTLTGYKGYSKLSESSSSLSVTTNTDTSQQALDWYNLYELTLTYHATTRIGTKTALTGCTSSSYTKIYIGEQILLNGTHAKVYTTSSLSSYRTGGIIQSGSTTRTSANNLSNEYLVVDLIQQTSWHNSTNQYRNYRFGTTNIVKYGVYDTVSINRTTDFPPIGNTIQCTRYALSGGGNITYTSEKTVTYTTGQRTSTFTAYMTAYTDITISKTIETLLYTSSSESITDWEVVRQFTYEA